MGVKIKSEWMETWVEILRILHNLDYDGFNDNLEAHEYVNLDKSKIMVVIADENGRPRNIETKIARAIHELSEENQYDRILVVGETKTKSAHNILMHNKIVDTITSDVKVSVRLNEILSVFHKKYDKISDEKSEKVLSDAKNISKNAEFHARMGWKDQLVNDFTQLIQLQDTPSAVQAQSGEKMYGGFDPDLMK